MKKTFTLFALIMTLSSFGQGFINGSFETTSAEACDLNNTVPEFEATMTESVTMFQGDQVDIHTASCYLPTIADGARAIGISSNDGISLELTETLVMGNEYSLTFWMYANNNFVDVIAPVQLACSTFADGGGDDIGTVTASTPYLWEEKTITFVAPNNGKHINIQNVGASPGWNQIDDFNIELIAASEITEEKNVISIYPNPTIGDVTINTEGTFDYSIRALDGAALIQGSAIGTEVVSLEDFAAGVYYIIVSANGSNGVYKVIKK